MEIAGLPMDHWKFEAKDHQLSSGGPSKFIVIEDFSTFRILHGLVSCKNEKDQIKTEGAIVFTTLYMALSDAKGQLSL